MLEIEREDRQPVPLRKRHHTAVDEAEAEIREAGVDLHRASEQSLGQEGHRVLPGVERREKRPGGVGADARAEKLIDLDDDGVGNEQLAPELGHERRSQPMRTIAAIRRGDQRAGIGDDPQRAATSSRR